VGDTVSSCDPVCDDVGWVVSPRNATHHFFFLSSSRCVATGKRATSNLTLPPIGRPPLFPLPFITCRWERQCSRSYNSP
jgi:hypothetical protein